MFVNMFNHIILIIIIHQHVMVMSVTIIRVSHNKNTIIMQIIVQKCVIKLLNITLYFFCSLR